MNLRLFLEVAEKLARESDSVVSNLKLNKNQQALNVHSYALRAYETFINRYYSQNLSRVVGIGMNPGKNGAVQTGIPFTDWQRGLELLPNLDKLVDRSGVSLPKANREQSGRRIYRWGIEQFGSYDAFFRNVLFLMTCPIAVLEYKGSLVKNVPLDKLPPSEEEKCFNLVLRYLPVLLTAVKPRGVLLLGNYAKRKWEALFGMKATPSSPVSFALHPAAHVNDEDWLFSIKKAWKRLGPA